MTLGKFLPDKYEFVEDVVVVVVVVVEVVVDDDVVGPKEVVDLVVVEKDGRGGQRYNVQEVSVVFDKTERKLRRLWEKAGYKRNIIHAVQVIRKMRAII